MKTFLLITGLWCFGMVIIWGAQVWSEPLKPSDGHANPIFADAPSNHIFCADAYVTNGVSLDISIKNCRLTELIEVLKWARDRDLDIGQHRSPGFMQDVIVNDCLYRTPADILRLQADKIDHDERMEKRLREILQKLEAK